MELQQWEKRGLGDGNASADPYTAAQEAESFLKRMGQDAGGKKKVTKEQQKRLAPWQVECYAERLNKQAAA